MAMGTRTPGPIHLFSRFRGASNVYYLGTCVAAPEPEHSKSRIPIMNDLAGRSEPFQIVKDGENAVILATMNRFDWLLLQSIRALDSNQSFNSTPLTGNANAGWELPNTRGTLVIGYTDFQLLLWYEYNSIPGSAGDIAGGVLDAAPIRIYSSVELLRYKESTVGTRVAEVACAFKATGVYAIGTRSFSGGTGLGVAGLYSDNTSVTGTTVAALAALVANAGA